MRLTTSPNSIPHRPKPFKVTLLTILIFIFSCEKPIEGKPVPKNSVEKIQSRITKTNTPAVEKTVPGKSEPQGLIRVPEELRQKTEEELKLDEKSAEILAKTLEQEIKE